MIIHGRTIETGRDGSVPIGHACIKVTGIWKNFAKLAETLAAPANIVFIRPPLYVERPADARCSAGALQTVPDSDTTLLETAGEGATRLVLADGTSLCPDDLLRIDSADPYREEVTTLRTIRRNSEADPSASVTLERPLMFAHEAGAVLQKLAADWEEQETALSLTGYRGQSTLFVRDLRTLGARDYLRIGSASAGIPAEVHRFTVYETESDRQGFYQLPPLQRVGQVQLEASREGRKVVVKFQPDFSVSRNQVDFAFKKSKTPDSAEDKHA